jgi:hypothetical protein
MLTSDYMLPVLVNAINELSAEVETLKQQQQTQIEQIAQMTARLNDLESGTR